MTIGKTIFGFITSRTMNFLIHKFLTIVSSSISIVELLLSTTTENSRHHEFGYPILTLLLPYVLVISSSSSSELTLVPYTLHLLYQSTGILVPEFLCTFSCFLSPFTPPNKLDPPWLKSFDPSKVSRLSYPS
jgi:hypothetical protein